MILTNIKNNQESCWAELSINWPSVPYSKKRWNFCVKSKLIPYGSYVVVGVNYTYPKRQKNGSYYDYEKAVIRCLTENQCKLLERIN